MENNKVINNGSQKASNKKAITPLMATFLLISFGVAIGVFFTNLAKAQVEESAVCPVNIGLREEKICYDGSQIQFSVQNGINTEIIGLIISVIGTEEAKTIELTDLAVAKGGVYSGTAAYDSTASGQLRQLKISPKISLYDEQHICLEQALILETISNC